MVGGGGATDGGEGDGGGPADVERHSLEGELLEVECTLAGEVQQIESLAQENNKKMEELRNLEEDVKTLQERNEYDVSMLQDEHTSEQQELAHRLSVLQEQLAQLTLKHERYKEVAGLCEEASAEVDAVLAKMERRSKAHAEEVHATRQEVLHLRQGLESTFRTTLKDLEGTYRRKAFKALGIEAKAGMRANKILREEMALQEIGVTALCEKHAQQRTKSGEFREELAELKQLVNGHKETLANLQRETRVNYDNIADMQETKTRIAAAERSLRDTLEKEGIPNCSVAEIRAMVLKEKVKAAKLDKLKNRWQTRVKKLTRAILPSSSEPQLSVSADPETTSSGCALSTSETTTISSDPIANWGILRGSMSEPPGGTFFGISDRGEEAGRLGLGAVSGGKGVEAAWKARVRRVVMGWTDIDDIGGRPHETATSKSETSVRRQRAPHEDQSICPADGKPFQGPFRQGSRALGPRARRSNSLPVLGNTLSSPSKPNDDSAAEGSPHRARQHASTVGGRKSGKPGGTLSVTIVCDEDPWEKKRRMERAVRRRDAQIRARGLAVNSREGRECRAGGG